MAEDESTLRLVQETLENLPLYYCLTRDLSRSSYMKPASGANVDSPASSSVEAASAAAAPPPASAISLWRTVDRAFTWNFHMCRTLLDAGTAIDSPSSCNPQRARPPPHSSTP